MSILYLTKSWQRSWGAMFRRSLGEDILIFMYPVDAPRTFHTFCCPPLRIVALTAEGQILSDEIISTWRLVRLPACRYVIETTPKNTERNFHEHYLLHHP